MRLGSVFDHPLFGGSNYDGNKSQTTERRNVGLGYRTILFACFREAYYRERVLFFSPTLPGGPNCLLFKGQLAIGQAGNLANPPLPPYRQIVPHRQANSNAIPA
ncbi:hypothetical protein AVEN_198184-1 [Araneus ventricosus]|uniref:Uncharacterized protein n=1 Tax=Araneus ventricosus TaxID=182803 RepID=A0A4Y2E7W4_ARAVE|nr:hypothetical protein AVEN_198184-1 [Araneus ventricosus]